MRFGIAFCLLFSLLPLTARGAEADELNAALKRREPVTALMIARPMAEKGIPIAEYTLATILEGGFGYLNPDYPQAIMWLRRAAEHGEPYAQATLGNRLANGHHVTQDFKEAVKWYTLSGNVVVSAAEELAGFYDKGIGVERNDVEALKWYHVAAKLGSANAEAAIGAFYIDARAGLKHDDIAANTWLLKSAQHGSPLGQMGMGQAYFKAAGVEQDFVKAFVWLSLAMKNPKLPEVSNEALRVQLQGDLDTLAKRLDTKQKADAEKQISEWRLTP